MVYSPWTPPSSEPSGFWMKRASRTGPVAVMNDGTVWFPPETRSSVAKATCGLGFLTNPSVGCGLVPPTSGSAWHAAQLLALKVGPRPPPASPATAPDTESISWNRPRAALKKACSFAFSAGKGPPAPFVPPRGPGSVCARTLPAPHSIKQSAIDSINAARLLHLFLDMIFPRVCPMLMGKPMDIRQPYTVELLSLCLNPSDALSDHF